MKRAAVGFVVWAFCTGAFAQETPIRNFLRVNAEFCTAGQPTLDQIAGLSAEGFRSVLNLRVPSEHDAAAEEAQVRAVGMEYFNIPIAGADIGDDQVEEFLRLTDNTENQPMFIHCGSANRVGALWLIKRVVRDGWSIPDAETEAATIGLRTAALKDFALQYIETHQTR